MTYQDAIPYIASPITAFVTWYVTKRSLQKTQEEESRTSIVAQNLDIYQRMINDLEERHQKQVKERDEKIQELLDKLNSKEED